MIYRKNLYIEIGKLAKNIKTILKYIRQKKRYIEYNLLNNVFIIRGGALIKVGALIRGKRVIN